MLDALLDKYADEGPAPVEDLGVLRVQPLSDLGTPVELIKCFAAEPGTSPPSTSSRPPFTTPPRSTRHKHG